MVTSHLRHLEKEMRFNLHLPNPTGHEAEMEAWRGKLEVCGPGGEE